MEDVLLSIVQDASGNKHTTLKKAAQDAHDLLCRQQGSSLRDPSHELRGACLTALQLALETRKAKTVTLALNGLHRVIRDERFHAGLEPENDSLWLPSQLLQATSSIQPVKISNGKSNGNQDTLVNVLRVLLAMACSPACTLNGRIVIEILTRCGECWETGCRSVRAAAQATASQTLRTFCAFLDEEWRDLQQTKERISLSNSNEKYRIAQIHLNGETKEFSKSTSSCSLKPTSPRKLSTEGDTYHNNINNDRVSWNAAVAVAMYSEVIPVMQFLISRLDETNVPPKLLFVLECLLTLLTALPTVVHENSHFTAFLWQKFCPALVAFLGTPRVDKHFISRDYTLTLESGRGSGVLGSAPTLSGGGARCVYLLVGQLVRLVGGEGPLRPVLEALFHRALLYPPPQYRAEALRWVRELFKSPERVLDLALLLNQKEKQSCSDDMAILRLIMDSLEECSMSGDDVVLSSSVDCVVALLCSLQELSAGQAVHQLASDTINKKYCNLIDVDYKGPLVYQSLARLPAPYRDVVAGLKAGTGSDCDTDSDDSGNHEDNSDNSGDTEGPEECASDNEVLSKPWATPRPSDPSQVSLINRHCDVDLERRNAKTFAKKMRQELVPKLLRLRTSIEVDESLQDFASRCCHITTDTVAPTTPIMNADGVYLATYSALLLSLKLMQAGHYENNNTEIPQVPLSESQFVDEVQNSGVLVYLSNAWLCELYQQIIAHCPITNLPVLGAHCALVDLLTDVGGLGPSQMLSEWQRLQAVAEFTPEPTPQVKAGSKLARRILTCCWDSIVSVLSCALGANTKGAHTKAARLRKLIRQGSSKKQKAEQGLISSSLEGLHKAATLSNTLSLQHLASSILTLLCTNVCNEDTITLSADHALSLDVLLTGGLELGSHNTLCWPAVLSACRHVCRLEHALFTGPSPPISIQATPTDRPSMAFHLGEDDETCIDVYSFLSAAVSRTSVSGVLSPLEGPSEVPLRPTQAARALCTLSQQVDSLFHDAALKLALPALCEFLKNLCHASREQLFRRNRSASQNRSKWWSRDKERASEPPTLLLHRVGGVTLKIVRGARPLLHTMRVWSIVGPHLMEAACHKDRGVSSRAVSYIHDCVTALLSEQVELPHFHFNEALLKPFENLLCLELCDSDVQDQIVSCLCETVEAHSCEIKSGWRPLFGTLRGARGSTQHFHSVSDIFRVFLSTDNALVFANAALDCILCLLAHIRTDSGSNADTRAQSETSSINIGLESLRYIENCAGILATMFNMPKCPAFNSAHRIQEQTTPQTVDPTIPNEQQNTEFLNQNENSDAHYISYRLLATTPGEDTTNVNDMDNSSGVLKVWFLLLEGLASATIVCPKSLQPDALETLFKLLRDLINTPGPQFGLYCINHLLLPMVQNWLRQTSRLQRGWENTASNFKHCCGMASDLIVSYLHYLQGTKEPEHEQIVVDSVANKLKCTVIKRPVDNLRYGQIRIRQDSFQSSKQPELKKQSSITYSYEHESDSTLALKQLLIVLTECTTQPNESIARLGVSCIRHVLLSSGSILTPTQWDISCVALHRACDVTLAPLRQLSLAFNEHSDSFYGDLAIVKVAARKDCSIEDNIRLNALAQQVLLLDHQRDCKINTEANTTLLDDRSYVFLLYPLDLASSLNPEMYTLRVPYRNLVVGLLAHQMLLQIIASIILHGNSNLTQLTNVLLENSSNSITTSFKDKLNQKHIEILLKCLSLSFHRALDFDSRPGLKFLLQKVSNIEYSTNLYKQSTSAWIIKLVALIELCFAGIAKYELSAEDVQYILDSCSLDNCDKVKKYECFVRYLIELRETWESLCDLYVHKIAYRGDVSQDHTSVTSEETNESFNLEKLQDEELEDDVFIEEAPKSPHKPFTFNDFKKQGPYYSSSSSECGEEVSVTENVIFGKYPEKTGDIENKEILSENSADGINQTDMNTEIFSETQKRVEAMLEQYKEINRSSGNQQETPLRHNPFNEKSQLAPQPVPPEIEQQRVHSMNKDNEARRSTYAQSLEAILELALSLPDVPQSCLRLVMSTGANLLAQHSSEPTLINAALMICQSDEN